MNDIQYINLGRDGFFYFIMNMDSYISFPVHEDELHKYNLDNGKGYSLK